MRSTTSKRKKLISCAISTGTFKPSSLMLGSLPLFPLGMPSLEDEADHDRDHQRVDRDGLGERDAQDHVCLDDWLRLRVAAQCLHRLRDEPADAQGRCGA